MKIEVSLDLRFLSIYYMKENMATELERSCMFFLPKLRLSKHIRYQERHQLFSQLAHHQTRHKAQGQSVW